MKRTIYLIGALTLLVSSLIAQDKTASRIPMMGETAPSFTAQSTAGTLNFPSDYPMQWKILFSHPADFTPVCTTELLELASLQADMKKLKTKLIVVSIDPVDKHEQWIKSMQELKYKNQQCPTINFPLVADIDHSVSKKYGMLQINADQQKDVRGVFIIDPQDKIRAVLFYPMTVGRNLDEVKRMLIALQTSDKEHVMTPANWQPGGDVLLPYTSTKEEADALNLSNDPNYYRVAWYMNFKKLNP